MSDEQTYYISITGLRLKKPWHWFRFMRHAGPCSIQARKTPGNIKTELTKIGHDHHTLTVWENRKAMLVFMHSAPHKKALGVFDEIATGKTYGYASDTIPTWEEARSLWEEYGREYRTPVTR